MQQTATVTKLLSGNQAELTVHRQTACGHDCSKCGGCGEMVTKPITVIADNTIGADIGDTVVITGSSKQVLGLAAIVYVIPVVLFLHCTRLQRSLRFRYRSCGAVQVSSSASPAHCLSIGIRRIRSRSTLFPNCKFSEIYKAGACVSLVF